MSSVTQHLHRRVKFGALAVLLVAVTFILAWWFISSGGTNQAVDSNGQNALVLAQDGEDGSEAAEGTTVDRAPIDVTYDVFLARDPFESIMPPEPVSTPPDPSAPSDPTAPSDPSAPSRPEDKDPVCPAGGSDDCDGVQVVVTETSTTSAKVEVNGTGYDVVPGQTFATNFTILAIDGICVDVLYLEGDVATTFRTCVGDVATK